MLLSQYTSTLYVALLVHFRFMWCIVVSTLPSISFSNMDYARVSQPFSQWTLKITAMDTPHATRLKRPPQAMSYLRFLFFLSPFFCFSLLFLNEKFNNFFILCQLVTCNTHLLFMPSLCICNSAFFCAPHVLAPWTPLESPGLCNARVELYFYIYDIHKHNFCFSELSYNVYFL